MKARHLLIRAHVLDGLRALHDESVHCVVTSPPYFSLRDYKLPPAEFGDGWRGQLGLEPSPALFVSHLVEVFREVRRVLRSDGAAFVVLGDSYAANRSYQVADSKHTEVGNDLAAIVPEGLKPGDLMGIPWRFAIAAQADGWILRSCIVWSKAAPMPESVSGTRWERHRVKVAPSRRATEEKKGLAWAGAGKPAGARAPEKNGDSAAFDSRAEWADCPGCVKCEPNGGLVLRRGSWRPTTAHEFIFMLAKSGDYFADGEELREVSAWCDDDGTPLDRYGRRIEHKQDGNAEDAKTSRDGVGLLRKLGANVSDGKRNLRSVWSLGPEPLDEAHFAAYPSEIPRRAILAGTSSGGVCATCAAPWARVLKVSGETTNDRAKISGYTRRSAAYSGNAQSCDFAGAHSLPPRQRESLGWRQTCLCATGAPVPATVLDPFVGSGTTGRVALELTRRFVGIELSAAYLFGFCRRRVVEADAGASLAEPLRLRTIEGPLFS